MNFKVLLVLGLCLCVITPALGRSKKKKVSKAQCEVLKGEAEKCIRDMFLKYFGKSPPKNDEEILESCKDSKSLVDCARKYKPCVKMLSGTIYSVALRTSKKMFKRICDTPEGRAELLSHLSCFTEDKKELGMEEMKKMIALVKYSANLDAKDLIPAGCCVGHYSRQNSEKMIMEQCQNGTDLLQYMRDVTLPNMNDMSPLICNKYLSLEDCYQNAPQLMEKIVELTTPPIDIEIEKESFIQPFLDLAERLSRQLEKGELEIE